MEHHEVLMIAGVLATGFACQWLAWKAKLPAILPLLAAGLLLGPVGLGIIHPREALGSLFFPFVSLSVAIILFEGALTLNFGEVRGVRSVVRNLLLIGAPISWIGGAIAAHYLMGLSWELALLFGALIIVTGPTVIAPILRNVRPTENVSSVLKWEGILIDPMGALLAVLVFDYIIAEAGAPAGSIEGTIIAFFNTVIIGSAMGLLAGYVAYFSLRYYLVPDYLRDFAIIALVTLGFAISNTLAPESGLLAVTVMGIFLANTRLRQLREIWYFKEKISILLISTLFILLAANFTRELLGMLDWRAFLVLAVIVFILRPLGVFVSSSRSTLARNEKLFLSWIAPRGIVAAAVSSLFTIQLVERGYSDAAILGPLVFLVIGGTVLVQGGTAKPIAQWLDVSEADPQGFLFLGSTALTRQLALILQELGFRALLVDSNYESISQARILGLDAYHGNVLSEATEDDLDLTGIGRMLAMTRNDEANALACKHMEDQFSSQNVYQLPPNPHQRGVDAPSYIQLARQLFAQEATYEALNRLLATGAEVRATGITEQFTHADFKRLYPKACIELMAVNGSQVQIATVDQPLAVIAGWTLISLATEPEIDAIEETEENAESVQIEILRTTVPTRASE